MNLFFDQFCVFCSGFLIDLDSIMSSQLALSTSINEISVSDFNELSSLLECSICLATCQVPIKQCKNGHNICGSHACRLSACPICRVPYREEGGSRNMVAEKLVEIVNKKVEEQNKIFGQVTNFLASTSSSSVAASTLVSSVTASMSSSVASTSSSSLAAAMPSTSVAVRAVAAAPQSSGNIRQFRCIYQGCGYQNWDGNATANHEINCHFR